MDIQQFLTYLINFVLLSSFIFLLFDLGFFLLRSWHQLSPSSEPAFYNQVKELFSDDTLLVPS